MLAAVDVSLNERIYLTAVKAPGADRGGIEPGMDDDRKG
jgi:hypothetical protein